MDEQGWQQQLRWWLIYVVSWVGSSALSLWLTLQLRVNLIDLNNFLGWGPWVLIGIDKFGILLLGLGWLIGVFVCEIYLRATTTVAMILRRASHLFLGIGAALAISFLLQWVLL